MTAIHLVLIETFKNRERVTGELRTFIFFSDHL